MAKAEEERLGEWIEAWDSDQVGWHMSGVNHYLKEFLDVMVAGKKDAKVLVPLCGKTVDMKWLADLGHTVVGIEGAEKAAKEFFTEQNVPVNIEQCDAIQGKLYRSADNKIRFYVGDFFYFNENLEGQFDAVWDRGSLIAVDEKDLVSYVSIIKSLLKTGGHCLAEVFDFDKGDNQNGEGHRSVSMDLAQKLFGDECSVKLLKTVAARDDAFYSKAGFADSSDRDKVNIYLISKN
ncbi:probable thiopurine S-methyltransferase [Lingula anatina]|uniref:thiopurine S-methyltransferase n=1 Tax=Lingula anatina TaxID=7574 RepID=A0A1S3HS05_LINAN|nr:probable thiopurine S-methyltransferase [Lingula anatina]|eukprot:XP_013388822.1 probable thiopurine S-methyltransferase [Lingula anatina]